MCSPHAKLKGKENDFDRRFSQTWNCTDLSERFFDQLSAALLEVPASTWMPSARDDLDDLSPI